MPCTHIPASRLGNFSALLNAPSTMRACPQRETIRSAAVLKAAGLFRLKRRPFPHVPKRTYSRNIETHKKLIYFLCVLILWLYVFRVFHASSEWLPNSRNWIMTHPSGANDWTNTFTSDVTTFKKTQDAWLIWFFTVSLEKNSLVR